MGENAESVKCTCNFINPNRVKREESFFSVHMFNLTQNRDHNTKDLQSVCAIKTCRLHKICLDCMLKPRDLIDLLCVKL